MPTNVPVGSPIARKLYSVATFAAVQRQPSMRKLMSGPAPKQSGAEAKLKGQSSPDFPFIRITDLASTQGDQVSMDLFNIITGKPVMGDKKLSGKMMSMSFSSMDVYIDQTRAGVDPGGRMAQKRTLHNLRTMAMANLAGYAARLEDQLALIHCAGARGDDASADWAVPLETDPDFSEIVVNTVEPPTANRRLFAGGTATSVNNLDTTDYLKLDDIDRLRAILDEEVFPMQPIKLPGDPEADSDNPLFALYLTSRQWHYLETQTGATAWRTFLSNATQRLQMSKHPLFMGQTGMWNGIVIKKMPRAIRFNAGSNVKEYNATSTSTSTVQAAVDTDRGLLFGAQALAEAYGSSARSGYHYDWHEEETDHGNTVETSIAMIGGKKKVKFQVQGNWTDHGVYTIDSYAPAVT